MKKLLKYLRPYGSWIAAVLGLILLQSISELFLPTLLADIVDVGIVTGNTGYILRIGTIMLLVAAGGVLCAILASYLSSKIATGFGRDLRNMIFTKVEDFSLQEFDKIGTATLITRTTNDVTQIQQVLMVMLRLMVSAPLMAVGGMIMAVSKNQSLSVVIVVVIPLLAAVIGLVAAKGVPLFKSMQVKLDKLNLVLRENLTGIRVIRAFNQVDYEKRRFNEANTDLTDTAIRVNKIMAALMPSIMIIMNFTTIAIMWLGSNLINQGQLLVGDLMAFIQYVMLMMYSLIMVSMMFVLIPRASASIQRINEVLETKKEIMDPEKPATHSNQRGFVEFRDVSFTYPGAEQPALQNISFCAGPGEVTAIIGGTGSGKSTLINLIPRFYDVSQGSILVNGIDIRDMTQKELRNKIGFVPQKAVLFSGSIAENIRFGKEDASHGTVEAAARVAQASDFIQSMKEGYDSPISQGGTNVSGGQKQRLSIARALVRRPEVYIFDDSFSALDFKTDAKLRSALKKETRDATVLIVAQRVSTVMDADRIIVLNEGKIAGMGTHKTLLDTCGIYREIVSSQLTEEELA